MVLPAIRADYRIVETHRSAPDALLECPTTALTGAEDPKVTAEEAAAWGEHTTAAFELATFPGGHFYLTEQEAPARLIATRLIATRLAAMAALTASAAPGASGRTGEGGLTGAGGFTPGGRAGAAASRGGDRSG